MSEKVYRIVSRKFNPIEVSKEFFDNYYREITAFRKREQYHGRCCCPPNKRLYCDMDCSTCPYSVQGDHLSLNSTFTDSEGNTEEWIDKLTDSIEGYDTFTTGTRTQNFVEEIADREYGNMILDYIENNMPELVQLGKLRMEGFKDVKIAEMLGIPNTTLRSRIEKMKRLVSEKFPDFQNIL